MPASAENSACAGLTAMAAQPRRPAACASCGDAAEIADPHVARRAQRIDLRRQRPGQRAAMRRGAEIVERHAARGRRGDDAMRVVQVQPVVAGGGDAGQPRLAAPALFQMALDPVAAFDIQAEAVADLGARDVHAIRADGRGDQRRQAVGQGAQASRAPPAASVRQALGGEDGAQRVGADGFRLRRARRARSGRSPAASAMARNGRRWSCWSPVMPAILPRRVDQGDRATRRQAAGAERAAPALSNRARRAGVAGAPARRRDWWRWSGVLPSPSRQRASTALVADRPGRRAPRQPGRCGMMRARRIASRRRCRASTASCGGRPASAGSGIEARKVPAAFGSGMRSRFAGSWKAAKFANSLAPARRVTSSASSRIVVGEEQEGRRAAPFLAHEQHGDLRAEQQQRGRGGERLRVGQRRSAVRRRRGCRPGRGSAGTGRRRSAAGRRRVRRAARRDGRTAGPGTGSPRPGTRASFAAPSSAKSS